MTHDLSDEHYMRLAIAEAMRGREEGEHPFGAVIVDGAGQVIVSVHDTVERDGDKTSHAETMLVKQACRLRGPDLSDCTIYTTTEPCPMCFTTAWLAQVSRIVYGSTMAEVRLVSGGVVEELAVPAADMNSRGGHRVKLVSGVLRDECLGLFAPAAKSAVAAAVARAEEEEA